MKAALALLVLVLAGLAHSGEPPKNENDAMQGAWAIESCKVDGNSIDPNILKTWRRTVAANHVTWKYNDEIFLETDFKFDATKKPMTLDSTITSADDKGQVFSAIYELVDGRLKVCSSSPGQARPSDFSAAAGTGLILFTAKRIEP